MSTLSPTEMSSSMTSFQAKLASGPEAQAIGLLAPFQGPKDASTGAQDTANEAVTKKIEAFKGIFQPPSGAQASLPNPASAIPDIQGSLTKPFAGAKASLPNPASAVADKTSGEKSGLLNAFKRKK